MTEAATDNLRNPHAYAVLMERYGWTVGEIDEMPDATLKWTLALLSAQDDHD